jgi:hypothetical protein
MIVQAICLLTLCPVPVRGDAVRAALVVMIVVAEFRCH